MAKIFISYRRDDSEYQTDRLHRELKQYVQNPKEDIFIDVDNIPFGVDFVSHLDGIVSQCEALLALIGPRWLEAKHPETGLRRIDDPQDFVRIEIASALKRGIPVVPVLLDGTPPPAAEDLPDDLKPLARRYAVPLQRLTFDADVGRLISGLPIDLKTNGKKVEARTKRGGKLGLIVAGLALLSVTAIGVWWLFDNQFWDWGEADYQPPTPEVADEDLGPRIDTTLGSGSLYDAVETPKDPLSDLITGESVDPASLAAFATELGYPIEQRVFQDCDDCPQMTVIPAGSFLMGSPPGETNRDTNEGPQRTVEIGYQLAVGKYETTWAEWDACVADGGCSKSAPDNGGGDEGWGKGSRPVINVSWEEAQAYARWMSQKTGKRYRLLTEAEWEYAVRAGTSSAYFWGDEANSGCAFMNGADVTAKRSNSGWTTVTCDDGVRNTAAVGKYLANAFGLHDMIGNVWEWTEDCYVNSYSGAPTDGSARDTRDCAQRIVRGGAWNVYPKHLRSADRQTEAPLTRRIDTGFRVARSL